MTIIRLYVGGLSDQVIEKDIKEKFQEYGGTVHNVELRCKENYGNRRYFAFVDIETDHIEDCIRQSNNQRWRGGCLKVQQAKESPLQAAQNEMIQKISSNEVSVSAKSEKQLKAKHRKQKEENTETPALNEESPAPKIPKKESTKIVEPKSFNDDHNDATSQHDRPKERSEDVKITSVKTENASVRLYVGGLSDSVLEEDLKKKFGDFGRVRDVEIRCKENYGSRRFFAYLDVETSTQTADECIRQLNNQSWKGGCLKVQIAKPSALQMVQSDLQNKPQLDSRQNDEPMDVDHSQQQDRFSRNDPSMNYGERKFGRHERRGNDYDQYPMDRQRQRNWGDSRSGGFDSEKADLFEDVDAADQLGFEEDFQDENEKNEKLERQKEDAAFHSNLKELFDAGNEKQFTLSSLFVDKLKVDITEDDVELPNPYDHHYEERRERAPIIPRYSEPEFKPFHRQSEDSHSLFFMLLDDERLTRGQRAFEMNERSEFRDGDFSLDKAEQLTLKLFQRKRNTRAQLQMEQRSSGKLAPAAAEKRKLRKALRRNQTDV